MNNTTAPERNKQLVLSLFADYINPGHLDRLAEVIAADFAGPNGETGPAGFADTIRGLRTGFPDIHFTVEETVADDDHVAVRWTWVGTHAGPFREFAPTGRRVTNTGVGIYQIRDGKITRAWVQTDRLGFQQQIGAPSAKPATQPATR